MKKLLSPACLFVVTVVAIVSFITPFVSAQETKQSDREAMYYRYLEFASYVKGGSVQPHWMADGSSLWYAEGAPENTVIWKVDPKANTRTPLFDTARLRKALAPLLGHEPPYQGLPFAGFTFDDGEKAVKFSVEGKDFILRLDTYKITQAPALSKEEKTRMVAAITDSYGHPNFFGLGSPQSNKEAFEYASNLPLAGNLKGKLLLIHGALDISVPLSHTMKMIDALTRAGKPYDLIILPDWDHWGDYSGRGNERLERYRLDAIRRYFQEHLKP